ncbi:MAG: YecA family protein [Lysobacterales bacterium]
MSATAPLGLQASELDELHTFLVGRAEAGALMLDAVHGLLTAIVVGPEPIPANEWLGHIIGEEGGFENEEQANRVLTLLIRLYNSIVQELEALSYQPIFGEIDPFEDDGEDSPQAADEDQNEGETVLSARGWCEGFSLGVDLRSGVWEARMQGDPQLLDLLSPLIAVAAHEGLFEVDPGEEIAELSDEEFEIALNSVAAAVADVQQYWRNQPAGPEENFPPSEPGQRPLLRKRGGHWLH